MMPSYTRSTATTTMFQTDSVPRTTLTMCYGFLQIGYGANLPARLRNLPPVSVSGPPSKSGKITIAIINNLIISEYCAVGQLAGGLPSTPSSILSWFWLWRGEARLFCRVRSCLLKCNFSFRLRRAFILKMYSDRTNRDKALFINKTSTSSETSND